MNPSELTQDQIERVEATIARQLRYLNNLCNRMTRLRFPPDDLLVRAATEARCRVQDLLAAVRYAGIKEGVGRKPE